MTQNDIQTLIDNSNSTGDAITLTPGTVTLTSPLQIVSKKRLHIYGYGVILQASGSLSSHLLIQGSSQCHIEGLSLLSSASSPVTEAIRMETVSGSTQTGNFLNGVNIDGTTSDGLGIGVRLVAGTGGDNNNDFVTACGVYVSNYSQYGISIEHSQSVGHELENCHFEANGKGLRGVNILAGHCNVRGGGLSGHTDTDIYLQNLSRVSVIETDSESSNRFLYVNGPTGAPYRICLRNCRVAADKLASDGRLVVIQTPGPFVMDLCDMGSGWANQGAFFPHVYVNTGNGHGLVGRMTNCTWSAHGSYLHPSVRYAGAGMVDYALQRNLFADSIGQAVVNAATEIVPAQGG